MRDLCKLDIISSCPITLGTYFNILPRSKEQIWLRKLWTMLPHLVHYLPNLYTTVSVSIFTTPGTREGLTMAANLSHDFPVSWEREQWPAPRVLTVASPNCVSWKHFKTCWPGILNGGWNYTRVSVFSMTAYRGRRGKTSRVLKLKSR
jgi:hypothetical protein